MRFSIAPTIVSLVTLCLSSLDLLPGAHALPRGGLRHYRPVRRTSGSLLDICAYIDGDVIGSLSILGINLNALVDLQICLCLSALPLALESNIQIQSLVQTYGASVVSDILVDLIHSSPSSQQCPHPPPNAKALCSSGNVCDFQCNSPYVRQGQTCGCAPPNIMCNGVCAPSSRGCGSAVPRSLGARAQNSLGIKTFSQAQAYCDSAAGVNQMVCGAPSGVLGFECLNVKTHLESCGGCTVPHPFADAPPSPVGVDCTAIEGADAVDCLNSRCFVKTCREGYQVGEAENTCIALLVSDSARVRTVAAMHVDRSLQDSLTPSSSTPSSHGDDYYRNADYRRHSLDTSLDNLSVVSSTAAVADSDCRDDLVDIPATLTSSTDLHTRQIEDNDVVYVGSGISDGTDNHGSRSPIRTDYVMERDTDLGFAWRGHDDDLVSYTGIALDTVGTSTTSVTDIRTHRARGRVNGGSTFHGIEGQGVATSDSSDSTRVGPLLDRRQLDGDVLSFTGVSLGPEGQTSRKKGGELLGSTLTDVWYRVRDSRPYLR